MSGPLISRTIQSEEKDTTGAREYNARNRLYEGGFPGALPSHDGDDGDIKIYVGSSTI
jgi:hypothetical protein